MKKLMYAMFLSTVLFIACETTRISDEMENTTESTVENTSDEDSKITTPMPNKPMKSNKKYMKPMRK
ncbi:Lp6.6 family lipoprotein (plasmid) [Borreliella sinica]|uniref:Lp6.6 family lipoprotein n=1 Tax=Borreliella sinica TaxID=87162 RepID=UPI002A241D6D|nr:Lp6.6 family lipoprotein [Borreliella sinica]WPM06413.1 Lp6.6 family lipoprotein [Borreliella sinica]